MSEFWFVIKVQKLYNESGYREAGWISLDYKGEWKEKMKLNDLFLKTSLHCIMQMFSFFVQVARLHNKN